MLSFHGQRVHLCDRLDRRQWIRIGGLGSCGLSLPQLWAGRARASTQPVDESLKSSFGKAKSCIILFMLGGPPQHETWDPKPNAPAEVRGELGSIPSATPGLHVGSLMPLTAKLTEHISVLRAMSTDDNAHSSSGYWMLTGYPHSPKNSENALPGAPNDWPCTASVVRHLRGDRTSLPGAVRLPEDIWNTGRIPWPGQDAGWLGDQADPWLLLCDPNKKDFHVGDISLQADISTQRFQGRRGLLDQMNRQLEQAQKTGEVQRWSQLQKKALSLLQSDESKKAFAIDSETDAMRDRYGRNRFGQSVLLARRLVESGVSLVQVNWTRWENDDTSSPAWDTHQRNSQRLKEALMPPMDQAYSALLEDLQQRGMLDETLVVWMGEFGRSPKINGAGGRDHWGHVFSAALAGGGCKGGVVYGQSDSQGAYPLEGRVEPQDLTATIFHCLGYTPETELVDKFGRPLVISKGHPIAPTLL
ncbi:MAG: hypothetical protein RLY14_2003 [Planctomycetota bacterium]